MYAQIRKLALLGPQNQLLLLRLWLMLGRTRLTLLQRGLSHFTAGLTLCQGVSDAGDLPATQLERARQLGHLVAIAARYTPWYSSCLVQVLVLKQLLARQHIPGHFSLGVRKAGVEEAAAIGAHAWLQCGDSIINGAMASRDYTTLSTFGWGIVIDR
jgi:hypothetical protein